MYLQRFFHEGLAQASYLVGCDASGEAIVVDANRDIDTYIAAAKAHKLRITHVTETHIHADYLSGSRELAWSSGARLYLSAEGGEDWRYEFPGEPLRDGDVISLGRIKLQVMHTPGHTPEHISFLLTDTPATIAQAGMQDRVTLRPGNLLDLDWGEGYDVVLYLSVGHNQTAQDNQGVIQHIAKEPHQFLVGSGGVELLPAVAWKIGQQLLDFPLERSQVSRRAVERKAFVQSA